MKQGEELRVTLEGSAFEGKSVVRIDGLVVFVHGGVPGDQVRMRITRTKKKFAEAEIVEVLVPSPVRVDPRCRHFGTCGGCSWQHVEYHAQLEFKRQHVVDALERIGGFKGISVNPTLGAEAPYFYRNKMEFSFGRKWLTREELESRSGEEHAPTDRDRFALGLHIHGRFDRVLDIQECWLQSETSYRIVNSVRAFCVERDLPIYSTVTHTGYLRNLVIRESCSTGELMVNLVTRDDRPGFMAALRDRLLAEFPQITTITNNITVRKSQVAVGDEEQRYHGPGSITERLANRTYRISANSFFQTNTRQAERLYETTRRMARLTSNQVVFDLYSGTGTIALALADEVAEVVGIESVESAIEDARENAKVNGVRNCTFVLGDLKDKLTMDNGWRAGRAGPDVIIVDPPRAGMHEKVVREIIRLNPLRIVYVSCNPSTQARDLKLLCEDGQYTIAEVQPVDMFPHTYHIESVVSLSRNPSLSFLSDL